MNRTFYVQVIEELKKILKNFDASKCSLKEADMTFVLIRSLASKLPDAILKEFSSSANPPQFNGNFSRYAKEVFAYAEKLVSFAEKSYFSSIPKKYVAVRSELGAYEEEIKKPESDDTGIRLSDMEVFIQENLDFISNLLGLPMLRDDNNESTPLKRAEERCQDFMAQLKLIETAFAAEKAN